jgi:hypothetical protein
MRMAASIIQRRLWAYVLLGAWLGPLAQADEGDKPMFTFASYGTLALTHSSEDRADYNSSLLSSGGVGYSRSWSGEVDSRLGTQLTGNFTPNLSAVVQLVFERRYDSSWRPTVEWANLRYQVNPDFKIRLGRIALPNFLDADYRKVGYATPWVRMPIELNNLVPLTNSDGLDVSYRLHWGETRNTIQAAVGTHHIHYPGDGHADVSAVRAISDTIEYDNLKVRLSYSHANLDLDLAEDLWNGFRQFGPPGMAIADRFAGHGKPVRFYGIGANYDPGDWFATAEYGRTTPHNFLGDRTGWYVGSGARFNAWTPYAMVAGTSVLSPTSDPGLDTRYLPPSAIAVAGVLNASLNYLLQSRGPQHTLSLGVRYDASRNTDLKLQLDRVILPSNSAGYLWNRQANYVPGRAFQLLTLSLDFTY